uniref:RRM domain-containing protein n=1 Tax=Alexandrium andersonii TaxID=327968 RepID=A0A7S2N403_9DINO|mmetsp:Transcript_83277/g.185896  ORF Transcript_83277/g.185896 Transcript_83277/m.185896 type:complete len:142 (+) Transcript_83277:117-542(+)
MGFGGNGKGKSGWTPIWQLSWQPWGKGGKGKGKGKGHRGFKIEQKVWIGGIPEEVTYKELFELMKPAGAKWVECFTGNGKGTGVACFATEEAAKAAIESLQGCEIQDAKLELDVWVRKPKESEVPPDPSLSAPAPAPAAVP